MTWDTSSSLLFAGNYVENRMMLHMDSPPLGTIPLGPQPMELDHSHACHTYVNPDRRLRLEQDIHPLMEYATGSFSYSSYANAKGIHATYHQPFPRTFRKDSAPIGSLYTGEFEYPSPSSLGVASISAGNRSPSPPEAVTSEFADPYFMNAGSGFTRMCWGGGDAAVEHRSVTPREVLHAMYTEPMTPVEEKVPQTFNPRASLYHPQEETLSDLDIINDDVDADGEPDAISDDRERSKPIMTDGKGPIKMSPKMKRSQRDSGSRKCAAVAAVAATTAIPSSPIRKRSAVASRKSSQPSTRNTKARTVKETTSSSSTAAAAEKTYSCSFKQYGCESTFSTKNEWKRHFSSQHLKLEFYRCDLCDVTSKGPNDFNRKDLFTQHLRRMHAPWTGPKASPTPAEKAEFEATLDEHVRRCRHEPRAPPTKTSCPDCHSVVFEDWSKRMEHMSQHYEHDSQFEEARDPELEAWARREKILCPRDSTSNELVLADSAHKRR